MLYICLCMKIIHPTEIMIRVRYHSILYTFKFSLSYQVATMRLLEANIIIIVVTQTKSLLNMSGGSVVDGMLGYQSRDRKINLPLLWSFWWDFKLWSRLCKSSLLVGRTFNPRYLAHRFLKMQRRLGNVQIGAMTLRVTDFNFKVTVPLYLFLSVHFKQIYTESLLWLTLNVQHICDLVFAIQKRQNTLYANKF